AVLQRAAVLRQTDPLSSVAGRGDGRVRIDRIRGANRASGRCPRTHRGHVVARGPRGVAAGRPQPGAAAAGGRRCLCVVAGTGVLALSRYAILDTPFTLFAFGGAALITVAALHDRSRLQWPGYVLISLAVLTKGPLAFVLCGLTLLLASAVSADARRRLLGLR